jgi:N-methylhydantoinase A
MYAYGGAGALHCPAVARELGISTVVIPLGDLAAGWSAFGVASADAVVVRDEPVLLTSPFDPRALEDAWSRLERAVAAELPAEVAEAGPTYQRFAEMRYAMQINQLTVPAPAGRCGPGQVDELVAAFEREYEQMFGPDSGYPAAGFVVTSVRVTARARTTPFSLTAAAEAPPRPAEPTGERAVIWYERGLDPVATPVYAGPALTAGSTVAGPAVVEFADTTLALREGQRAALDRWNSLVVTTA